MFDLLIKFILDQITSIIPIAVIHQYQGGVRYRFGRYEKVLKPGWHFKFPYIQTVAVINTVDTTMQLSTQSLITEDNKQFILKGSVGYRIIDTNKYFNNIYDALDAIADRASIILREQALGLSSDEIKDLDVIEVDGLTIQDLLQEKVKDYGFEIIFFKLITVAEGRSYRIYHEALNL